jgi:hypothetical protein
LVLCLLCVDFELAIGSHVSAEGLAPSTGIEEGSTRRGRESRRCRPLARGVEVIVSGDFIRSEVKLSGAINARLTVLLFYESILTFYSVDTGR